MSPPDFGTELEHVGEVDIGRIHFVFRVGDLAAKFRDLQSRLRAELRSTMDYLGRTARTEMASLAPVGKGNLRASIDARIRESDTAIHVTVRPRARYAFAVEGGKQGSVRQYVRRPPGNRIRKQATLKVRAKWVREGAEMVRVREYQRHQTAQPFIRPTYQDMIAVTQQALEAAVARATRGEG